MWYQNRPYRRHMRRGISFPFVFPFIILFFFHSIPIFFATVVLAIMVALIFSALSATTRNSNGLNNPWNQPQQQVPYYQPPIQTYQPPYQPYQQGYKPYEQEYQSASATYQANQQQAASSASSYEDYEQPHAQYPEQMPPIQQ